MDQITRPHRDRAAARLLLWLWRSVAEDLNFARLALVVWRCESVLDLPELVDPEPSTVDPRLALLVRGPGPNAIFRVQDFFELWGEFVGDSGAASDSD